MTTLTGCSRRQSFAIRSATLLALCAACVVSGGCRRFSGHKAPLETFTKGQFRTRKGAIVTPPEAANKPWRVLALQVEPRPVKNPRWSSIAIEASGSLEMPEKSTFECVYTPVKFEAAWDETMDGVDEWKVLREIRCSNDGWITYSGAGLGMSYDREGKLQFRSADQAELELSEVIRGRPTKISILLRPD